MILGSNQRLNIVLRALLHQNVRFTSRYEGRWWCGKRRLLRTASAILSCIRGHARAIRLDQSDEAFTRSLSSRWGAHYPFGPTERLYRRLQGHHHALLAQSCSPIACSLYAHHAANTPLLGSYLAAPAMGSTVPSPASRSAASGAFHARYRDRVHSTRPRGSSTVVESHNSQWPTRVGCLSGGNITTILTVSN
jgi:hypothetical protein